jgi:hypothetical protein
VGAARQTASNKKVHSFDLLNDMQVNKRGTTAQASLHSAQQQQQICLSVDCGFGSYNPARPKPKVYEHKKAMRGLVRKWAGWFFQKAFCVL